MKAVYNEHDSYAAQWLRNLIQRQLIAPGDVLECSVVDLTPNDLRKYAQVHLFAGVGIWSASLRDAGVRDDEPFWTASCPCQPFSAAGKGGGFDDERHLWPATFHLVEQCRPVRIAGEQVASKDGLAWLDLVQSDMEGAGYAFGAVDTCAAGFGAPHIRQRLYWVADAANDGLVGRRASQASDGRDAARFEPERLCDAGRLGQPDSRGRSSRVERAAPVGHGDAFIAAGGICQLADAYDDGLQGSAVETVFGTGRRDEGNAPGRSGASLVDATPASGPTNGFWSNPDWLFCRDGKWRPVEAGTFPLAHGESARVGRLRAYGNQIVRPQAAAFLKAYLDCRP